MNDLRAINAYIEIAIQKFGTEEGRAALIAASELLEQDDEEILERRTKAAGITVCDA